MDSELDRNGPDRSDAEFEAWLDEVSRQMPEQAEEERLYWERQKEELPFPPFDESTDRTTNAEREF